MATMTTSTTSMTGKQIAMGTPMGSQLPTSKNVLPSYFLLAANDMTWRVNRVSICKRQLSLSGGTLSLFPS